MWEEEYEKEFVIDAFQEECLDIIHFEGNSAFADYQPQSLGEPLDFWFEIQFTIDEQDKIASEINANF